MKYFPTFCAFLLFTLFFNHCNEKAPAPQHQDQKREWEKTHDISKLITAFGNGIIEKDSVAIVGTIFSSDESGNLQNLVFLRDESSAIGIKIKGDQLHEDLPRGANILIKCKGLMLNASQKMLSGPNGEALTLDSLDQVILRVPGTSRVDPIGVSLSNEILNPWISNLIEFEGFEFPETGIGKTLGADEDTLWTLTHESGKTIPLLVSAEADFKNEILPKGAGSVTGILTYLDNKEVIIPQTFDHLRFNNKRRLPYEKKVFSHDGNNLPYQIMYPFGYEPTDAYPLVVFLHGAGERGSNNTSQMAYGPSTFGTYKARLNYPAIVIFPQCPSDVMWSRRNKYQEDGTWIFEFPVEENPNYVMEMVIELVHDLMEQEGVDDQRIYITGLSMGGIGVFEFCYYAPELPAAGISMAGGHDPSLLNTYGNGISFWLFHGANDNVVPPQYSRDLFQEMETLQLNARYSEDPDKGHQWNYVLEDPEYLEWMFNQRKN
jgi:poly(3-hydroxybutyrate) depolymerase